MYELLGICLVFAALLTINALASVISAAGWRLLEPLTQHWSSRSRADMLFAVRISPPVLAITIVALFLIPSYVGYEPHATSEVVSMKLAALAFISGAGVIFAAYRCLRSWLATRSLHRQWLLHAEQIRIRGISIPTFSLSHPFPVIAVIGTIRPCLFIADHVRQSLTNEELAAAIAHEYGHLAARDNFKRLALRLCRDLLMIVPCGHSLDREWSELAESAADEHAAEYDREAALNLAAALIKIAKMIPPGSRTFVPLAAFLVGVDEARGVKSRVRRLLEIASGGSQTAGAQHTVRRIAPVLTVAALALLTVAAASPGVLIAVHRLIENIVKLLS